MVPGALVNGHQIGAELPRSFRGASAELPRSFRGTSGPKMNPVPRRAAFAVLLEPSRYSKQAFLSLLQ